MATDDKIQWADEYPLTPATFDSELPFPAAVMKQVTEIQEEYRRDLMRGIGMGRLRRSRKS